MGGLHRGLGRILHVAVGAVAVVDRADGAALAGGENG